MITEDELKQIRDSLLKSSENTYVSCHSEIHQCCDGRVQYNLSDMNLEGHCEDCHLMKSLKIVEDELNRLETEYNLNFSRNLKY